MMRIIMLVILLGFLGSWSGPAWSQNPFTSKPEVQDEAPEPLFKSRLFAKIIRWQHELKQRMSEFIRVAQSDGGVKPLFVLIGIAFLYGVVHAAGPGHGKIVAMSYVLSHRSTVIGGVLFGLCFAATHALSGVVGVLGLRYIIRWRVGEALATVTTVTQIVSFGLITLLGLGILLKHGCALFLPPAPDKKEEPARAARKGALPWAVAAGLVPCPAVVMVMLFCLSMDVMILGLLLVASISIGMASTISFAAAATAVGKTVVISAISGNRATGVEGVVGALSGGTVAVFGALFLLSAIGSVAH